MTTMEQVENQIRAILATETQAIPLSNHLFAPDGLFSLLGRTEEDRRIVVHSALFRQALNRLSELQQREGSEFARAVQQSRAAMPEHGFLVKLEQAPNR